MSSSPDDPMIGKRISHYLILDKLGQGGMGTVYLAEDMRLGRRVALKQFPPDMADDRERLRRFQREAKLVASLNHPGIVTLFGVEAKATPPFFTMELVEGETLETKVPAEGLSLDDFFAIAIPFTDALAAAHASGITHRDLKPANIMVTPEGRVKVLDFGIAKLQNTDGAAEADAATALTREGTFIGTIAYMAPEQVKGDPPDSRSDIFATGIILYQMATGRQPFVAKTSAEMVSSILRDEPPSVAEVKVELPNQLGDIIRKCLTKEPDERYQRAQDLRDDLKELHRQLDTGQLVTQAVQMKRYRRKARAAAGDSEPPRPARRALPLAIAAAVGVLLLAAAGWWLWRGRSTPPPPDMTAVAEPAPDATDEAAPAVVLRPDVVAVLPLRPLGDDVDALFCEGLTDDLASRLTSLPGIQVVSPTRLEAESLEDLAPAEAARALGAGQLLRGTARWEDAAAASAGPRIRVNLQLIRVSDGIQTWSEVFDRELESPLAVQGEIARATARGVGTELLGSIPEDLLARWREEETAAVTADGPPATPPATIPGDAPPDDGDQIAARPPSDPTGPPGPRASPPQSSTVRPVPPVVTRPRPRPAPPRVAGELLVEFSSDRTSGVVTIYADAAKLLEREFRGRRGFLGRAKRAFKPEEEETPAEFVEELRLPSGAREVRIYVISQEGAAPVETVPIDLMAQSRYRLSLTVDRDGEVEVALLP